MIREIQKVLLGLCALASLVVVALFQNTNQKYDYDHTEICFTPEQKCTPFIAKSIESAKHQIRLQAYTLTSRDICNALLKMHKQGVSVKVILDKTNLNPNQNVQLLQNGGIEILIDHVPGIAHNKIVIIDDISVLTGSFNFSNAADTRNVENVLKITSKDLTKRYLKNWNNREKFSQPINHVVKSSHKYKPWKDLYHRKPIVTV